MEHVANHPPRFAVAASTGGAVLNQCLTSPMFRSHIHSVICDRECGAAVKARSHGLPVQVHPDTDSEAFSDAVLEHMQAHQIDYVLSFYTNFFSEELRRACRDRLVNLHPSLLPAFKGNDAWEYVRTYGVRFIGSTVEFIYERMDEGKIILQAVYPWDDSCTPEVMRHRLFVQQCKSLLQVTQWLAEGRVRTDGHRVVVDRARFDSFEFSPALDCRDAIDLVCPFPHD